MSTGVVGSSLSTGAADNDDWPRDEPQHWPVGSIWMAASVFLASTVIANWPTLASDRTETGDFAADSLRSRAAWAQADGVFSRWDYHHPGPVLFWLKWIGEAALTRLGVDCFGAQMLGFAVFATASIAAFTLAVANARNCKWIGWVAFGLAFAGLPDGIVMVPWGPIVGNWFLLLALAGVAAAVQGRMWGAPTAVFAAFGLVHLHLLFVPLAAASLAGLGWLIFRRRLSRTTTGASVVVGVLMLVPLAVAVARGTSPWGQYLTTSADSETALFRFPLNRGIGRVLALLAPASQGDGGPMLVGFAAVFSITLGAFALALAMRGSSNAIRVSAAGGLLAICFLLGVSRMDFLTRETIGRVIPLMILVTSTAEFGARLQRRRKHMALALLVGALLLSTLGRPPLDEVRREGALRGSGAAESALDVFARSRSQLLVIDYRDEERGWSYSGAASAAVLAARQGVKFCIATYQYPYWADTSMLCPRSLEDAIRVTFTSPEDFTAKRVG